MREKRRRYVVVEADEHGKPRRPPDGWFRGACRALKSRGEGDHWSLDEASQALIRRLGTPDPLDPSTTQDHLAIVKVTGDVEVEHVESVSLERKDPALRRHAETWELEDE